MVTREVLAICHLAGREWPGWEHLEITDMGGRLAGGALQV